MGFRQGKLLLALGILAVGMAAAVAWHGWQGWVLHRGYPWNTFLFLPSTRFSDLTQVISASNLPSPYEEMRTGYFPATYAALRCLGNLSIGATVILYAIGSCLCFVVVLVGALRGVPFRTNRFFVALGTSVMAIAFVLFSYPLWFSLDRGNIELVLAALVALALLCFSRRQFSLGIFFLFPAICFKVYPGLLLALFLRSRHFLKIIVVGILFAAVNLTSLCSFSHGVAQNLHLWQRDLAFCKLTYLMHGSGLGATASPWSTLRALLITCDYFGYGFPADASALLNDDALQKLFRIYSLMTLIAATLTVLYAVFLEAVFFRRAILLLLVLTLIVPYGGEYRLIYANIALVILALLPGRRKYDLAVLALLAFVVIPKREICFAYLGPSDSGFHDISIGVFLNAPCMLAALLTLMYSGWPANPWKCLRLGLLRFFHTITQAPWKRRYAHVQL